MSNPKQAAVDIADALKVVFRKHTLNNRERGWDAITSKQGMAEVDKLIRNPNRSTSTIRSLNFREWLQN